MAFEIESNIQSIQVTKRSTYDTIEIEYVPGSIDTWHIDAKTRQKIAEEKLTKWFNSERNFAIVTDKSRVFVNVYAMYQCLKNIIERNGWAIEIWYSHLGKQVTHERIRPQWTNIRRESNITDSFGNHIGKQQWRELHVRKSHRRGVIVEKERKQSKEILAVWRRVVHDPVTRYHGYDSIAELARLIKQTNTNP